MTGPLLATGTAAATPGNGKREAASAENTLFGIVEASDYFDTLELALAETGLVEVLDGKHGQSTVFAPTDESFGNLLDELGVSAGELSADLDSADILSYHVTSGRRYESSIVNAPRVEMPNGDSLQVAGTERNGGGPGGASVAATNSEAGNGVAIVIDGMLLPPGSRLLS